METRPYFIFGDLVSNLLIGAGVGAVTAALVSTAWPMLPAMIVGMFLGMALCIPIQTACSLCFGAFEVMIPMMLTSMVAGMVVAMKASMHGMAIGEGAVWGASIGVPVLLFTYAANAMLVREAR